MSLPGPIPASGLIAAPFTPLHRDGTLAPDTIGSYAAFLASQQVAAAFVCGTTGEGAGLTTEERQQVALRWREDKPAALRLIVHVGHSSLPESQALARHAEKIGADAIAAIAPGGATKPASLESLVEWCALVAGAAPTRPFYFYHMPAMNGVHFAMADFLPRALARIPTFAGIKFTHENLLDYSLTVTAAAGKYPVLFGRDEILLGALALGATGAVGSTYNYMAPVFHRIMAAFTAGRLDAALREQRHAQKIIEIMIRHGGLSAGKAIMGLIGLECGPMRPPLTTLTPAQIAALRAELDAAGFFSAIAPAAKA